MLFYKAFLIFGEKFSSAALSEVRSTCPEEDFEEQHFFWKNVEIL